MKPENLPDSWEYQKVGHTVTCGECYFRFGAEHPNSVVIGPDTWTCPNCGDGNHSPTSPCGNAMTDEETTAETEVATARLAALFSPCHSPVDSKHHLWNFTTRECMHCKAPYPYPEYAR